MAQRVGGSPHSRLGGADGGCEPAAHDRLRHQRERLCLLQPEGARVAPDRPRNSKDRPRDGRGVVAEAAHKELTRRRERVAALIGQLAVSYRGGCGDTQVERGFAEHRVKRRAERQL